MHDIYLLSANWPGAVFFELLCFALHEKFVVEAEPNDILSLTCTSLPFTFLCIQHGFYQAEGEWWKS